MATGLESLLSGNLGVGQARGSDVYAGFGVKPAYAEESGLDYSNVDYNNINRLNTVLKNDTGKTTTTTGTGGNPGGNPGGGTGGTDTSVIDQYYADVESALRGAESNAMSGLGTANTAAESQYNANVSAQNAAKESNMATINEASITAQDTKESAAAAARRLYNELQTGYRQRFGGASSAGEAAYVLSGLEQQRSQAAITKDYTTAVRQIATQKTALEQAHNSAIQQLKANYDSAKNSILQQYNSTISQINSDRTTAASAKASAKLEALQSLKNSTASLNSSAANYESVLTNSYNTQNTTLNNAATKLTSASTGATSAANTFGGQTTTNPTSALQDTTYNTTQTAVPTGYTSPLKWTDKYGANY